MKAVFTRFFSVLKANTPPSEKRYSSRKFLSLFLILFLAVGNAWAQETVEWIPTEADLTILKTKKTEGVHYITVGEGDKSFRIYGVRNEASGSTDVKLSFSNSAYKMGDNSLEKAGLAVYIPEGSAEVKDVRFYMYTSKNRKTYYASQSATCPKDGISTDVLKTEETAYSFFSTFSSNTYYCVGGKTSGSGDVYFTKIEVVFAPSTPATKYSVTYDLNGVDGTVPTQEDVAEGTEITLAAAPTAPAGQEFAGWSDGTNTYAAGATYTMGAAAVTFTAQWQAETPKYDVTYDLNGGTGTEPTQGKVAENGTFTVASAEGITPPAGKEFAGWSDGTNTYNAGATYTMGAAAVTFTAQWKAAPTVIFDWTAANSSNIEADNTDLSNATYGTLTVGTSVAGRLLGTNTIAKSSSGYKLGNNDVCIEIQGTSAFEEGDIVVIIGKNGGDGERSFAIAPESATAADAETVINTSVIGAQTDNSEYKVVITATQAGTKMRVFRLAGKSMYVKSIKVIRPAQKEILSTDITLSAVIVNTEAISAENLATLKADPYKLDLTSEYAEAPTIAFTKQTVITYEDATTKTKTETIEVAAIEVDGKWQAQTEINAITYTVTALIPATYTVIYKDGETILASETVKVGEHPTAAGVTTNPHYSLSWKLAEEIVELASVDGTADQEIILTAVWTPKYAATIDFTTYVQEERLTKSLADVLKDGNHNYICGGTFNKSEWGATSEDAAYQGYKFKDNGVYIEFLLQSGKRATFLFGNYGSTGTIKVGTAEATECTPSDSKYVVNATSEDVLVRFTTGGTGTVTLKSITIGEIPTISDDATLKDLKVNGTTIAGFNSATTIYYLTVPYGTEVANMPKITEATPNHASAAAVIYPEEGPEWEEEYGCYLQQVVVTAEDGTKGYYHVRTTVDAKQGVTIIKATHTGATTADVIGAIGGTCDKKTQSDGKLGSNGHYFGIKLAEGTFKSGDVIKVVASALNGGNTIILFADNEGTTEIGSVAYDQTTKTAYFTLTADVENVYIYRVSSACNSNVEYIEVQRDMDPFIESFVVAGAPGVVDEASKTIAVEVSASTDVTALTPTIVAWANGGAKVTPTGAQDFTNPVVYSVASAYAEDGITTYTVTVTQAAASTDATLKTLTINGNALTLVDGVYEYDYELPYGTTAAPTVVAEENDANATAVVTSVSLTKAVITVTAEDGTTQEKYTINFTISPWQNIVIWDGSTMDAVAASPDASGLTWEVNGFGDIANYTTTCGSKTYSKVLPSGGSASDSRNFKIVIPDGYLAKFYIAFASHSDGGELRGMSIGTTINKNLDTSIYGAECNTRSEALGGTSVIVGAGTYYINPRASIDFCEVSVLLRPGYIRTGLTVGSLGTICLPSNVPAGYAFGATFYELVGKEPQYGKIVFDEILSGELEAGKPYLFQAQSDVLYCFYGTESVSDPDNSGAMKGTFVNLKLTDLTNIYYFAQKALWSCVDLTDGLSVPANRAYVKMDEMPAITESNPAPGVRRITLGVNGQQVATGVDQVQGDEVPTKMIINGQLFILRGEKMYDAQGKLVK